MVYVGTISARRDFEFLIDILAHVKQTNNKVKLYVMGWYNKSTYRKQIRDYILSKGLKEDVIFTGMVNYEELPKWLSKFNLGISKVKKSL